MTLLPECPDYLVSWIVNRRMKQRIQSNGQTIPRWDKKNRGSGVSEIPYQFDNHSCIIFEAISGWDFRILESLFFIRRKTSFKIDSDDLKTNRWIRLFFSNHIKYKQDCQKSRKLFLCCTEPNTWSTYGSKSSQHRGDWKPLFVAKKFRINQLNGHSKNRWERLSWWDRHSTQRGSTDIPTNHPIFNRTTIEHNQPAEELFFRDSTGEPDIYMPCDFWPFQT